MVLDIFALLNCLVFFSVIIYRFIRINIKSILQITHVSVPTLMKDFQLVIDFKETSFCRYQAYIFISIIGVLFWNYGLLAFFSFVRVIHPTKLWLYRSSTYLFVFINLLPLLFIFDTLHQIPKEAYCGIAYRNDYFGSTNECYMSITHTTKPGNDPSRFYR